MNLDACHGDMRPWWSKSIEIVFIINSEKLVVEKERFGHGEIVNCFSRMQSDGIESIECQK